MPRKLMHRKADVVQDSKALYRVLNRVAENETRSAAKNAEIAKHLKKAIMLLLEDQGSARAS